jgi:hypothetical protein
MDEMERVHREQQLPDCVALRARRKAAEARPGLTQDGALALQRAAGNAAVARMIQAVRLTRGRESAPLDARTLARQDASAESPANEPLDPSRPIAPGNYKLTLAVDREGGGLFDIGHAWIVQTRPDGSTTSFGYYPEKFDRDHPFTAYPPKFEHPDTFHTVTTTHTVEIGPEEFIRAQQYAIEHGSDPYVLVTNNCATFATRAFRAATGKSPPGTGLAWDSPTSLAHEIEKYNRLRNLDPRERRLPPHPGEGGAHGKGPGGDRGQGDTGAGGAPRE